MDVTVAVIVSIVSMLAIAVERFPAVVYPTKPIVFQTVATTVETITMQRYHLSHMLDVHFHLNKTARLHSDKEIFHWSLQNNNRKNTLSLFNIYAVERGRGQSSTIDFPTATKEAIVSAFESKPFYFTFCCTEQKSKYFLCIIITLNSNTPFC